MILVILPNAWCKAKNHIFSEVEFVYFTHRRKGDRRIESTPTFFSMDTLFFKWTPYFTLFSRNRRGHNLVLNRIFTKTAFHEDLTSMPPKGDRWGVVPAWRVKKFVSEITHSFEKDTSGVWTRVSTL